MESLAQQLAQLASEALGHEDKILQEYARSNPAIHTPGKCHPGILRFDNEHHYQFLVARHLVRTLPYLIEAEVDKQDLILRDPHSPTSVFATIEMKRWMSATGLREIKGIRRDLEVKLPQAEAHHKIMMIFSANPVGTPDPEAFDVLIEKLEDRKDSWSRFTFNTFGHSGEPFIFWVATKEI